MQNFFLKGHAFSYHNVVTWILLKFDRSHCFSTVRWSFAIMLSNMGLSYPLLWAFWLVYDFLLIENQHLLNCIPFSYPSNPFAVTLWMWALMMNSKRQYLLANGQGVLGQLGVIFLLSFLSLSINYGLHIIDMLMLYCNCWLQWCWWIKSERRNGSNH